MNIPGLISIEYTEASETSIPVFADTAVTDSAFSGAFIPFDFTPTTGGFVAQYKKDSAGNLYFETTLNFFVPEPDADAKEELNAISQEPPVFKVTDAQNTTWIIGDQTHPARVTYTEQLDPAHTGLRGYAVTAVCTNITGPLILTTATDSSAS